MNVKSVFVQISIVFCLFLFFYKIKQINTIATQFAQCILMHKRQLVSLQFVANLPTHCRSSHTNILNICIGTHNHIVCTPYKG
jgi:hypothetical protein